MTHTNTAATAATPTPAAARLVFGAGTAEAMRLRSRTGLRKSRDLPAAFVGFAAQVLVGVDGDRVADLEQHRQVGDGVRIGVRPLQIEVDAGGELADRERLLIAVRVELELARVLPVDAHLGARGDHAGDAEVPGERTHDLLRRGRHDVDATTLAPVQRDEVQRLLIHVRIDHVEDHILDETFDLGAVPSLGQLQHAFLQAVHLLLVRADQQVHQLRVRAAQQLAARDHARPVQRPRERERGRPADDRLVEVEERRFHTCPSS